MDRGISVAFIADEKAMLLHPGKNVTIYCGNEAIFFKMILSFVKFSVVPQNIE